jgi:hypothetical protein
MPLIPELQRQIRRISELEATLMYGVSFRTARSTQRNPEESRGGGGLRWREKEWERER